LCHERSFPQSHWFEFGILCIQKAAILRGTTPYHAGSKDIQIRQPIAAEPNAWHKHPNQENFAEN
jgi:hypothetical protein